jgi:hypothetical protein
MQLQIRKKRENENLPIELGVVDSYCRFYRTFFTHFTKTKRSASFFEYAVNKTCVTNLAREIVQYTELYC